MKRPDFGTWLAALGACILLVANGGGAAADEISVAVAANFTAPAQKIAGMFEARTGHVVRLSFGATGQLFAQIGQGAPFDVFLSADRARPAMAEEQGLAVPRSRFTYAVGRLVLWSADPAMVDAGGAVLRHGEFAHVAIANPETAPYGAAAVEVMTAMGVFAEIEPKLVRGASVSQARQFVMSGNSELGFIALSQVTGDAAGSRWIVPETLYSPIRQDAVLLKDAERKEAAVDFVAFLGSPEARDVIESFGYGVLPPSATN
ncbi:MAG: molybdate ABC transporter substrate-binding protein [Oricola sp.]